MSDGVTPYKPSGFFAGLFETPIKWRDVLRVDIKDPVLAKHVEGFLDLWEKSVFTDPKDPKQQVSGQEMLKLIKTQADWLKANPGFLRTPSISDTMRENNLTFTDGKLSITAHNRILNPSAGNPLEMGTSITIGVHDGTAPRALGISLGIDELRSAVMRDVKGSEYRLTVDSAVAHELAHLAYDHLLPLSDLGQRRFTEAKPIAVERIISAAMGGEVRNSIMPTQRGQEGDFVTLYQRFSGQRGEIEMPIRHALAPATEGELGTLASPRIVSSEPVSPPARNLQ